MSSDPLRLRITIQEHDADSTPVVAEVLGGGVNRSYDREEIVGLVHELPGLASLDYGRKLGEGLFQGAVRSAFEKALAIGGVVRTLLYVQAPSLRHLRWERIHGPIDGTWLPLLHCERTPLTRFIPGPCGKKLPKRAGGATRALLLAALEGDHASRAIAACEEALGLPCDVLAREDVLAGAVGRPTLDECCRRLSRGGYGVLHVLCHGERLVDGDSELHLWDEDGGRRPVTSDELVHALALLEPGARPPIVFLASCESGAPPRSRKRLRQPECLAELLVRRLGVPAVVAMTDVVTFETANGVAGGFYAGLAERGDPSRALARAFAGFASRADSHAPALFGLLEGETIFTDDPVDLTREEVARGGKCLEALFLGDGQAGWAPALAPEVAELAAAATGDERRRGQALTKLDALAQEVLEISFVEVAGGRRPIRAAPWCPFQGLKSFGVENAPVFFGRERLVDDLTAAFERDRRLLLSGPSGVGKSSLALAGIVPKLLAEKTGLVLAVVRPDDPVERVRRELDPSGPRRIVVVDQGEQAFSARGGDRGASGIFAALAAIADRDLVLVTVRADRRDDWLAEPTIGRLFVGSLVEIEPLTVAELKEAIRRQVAAAGLVLEGDLADRLLADLQGPGLMPLAQHALRELYDRRHGRHLLLGPYEAMGRISGSIVATARDRMRSLSAEDHRRVQRILLRLVRFRESERDERRQLEPVRCPWRHLTNGDAPTELARTKELAHELADADLIAVSEDGLELAHEEILKRWPEVEDWAKRDREFLEWRDDLQRRARRFEQTRDGGELLRGPALELARAHRATRPLDLNPRELEIVRSSERRARRDRIRRSIALAAIPVVGILLVTMYLRGEERDRRARILRSTAEARAALAIDPQRSIRSALAALEIGATGEDDSLDDEAVAGAKEALLQALHLSRLEAIFAHSADVNDVTFSPNGRYLLTGGLDGMARVWDLEMRREVPDWTTDAGSGVWALAWEPSGRRIAVGSSVGSVKLRDLDRPPEEARELPPDERKSDCRTVHSVAFHPRLPRLAVGTDDGDVTIWDVADEPRVDAALRAVHPKSRDECIAREPGNPRLPCVVRRLEFDLRGRRLGIASHDEVPRIWDAADEPCPRGGPCAETWRFASVGSWVRAVAFHPGDEWVLVAANDPVPRLYAIDDRRAPRNLEPHADPLLTAAFSPDGSTFATGGVDWLARLTRFPSLAPLMTLAGHRAPVVTIAFDRSDGARRLATASEDDTARVWSTRPIGSIAPRGAVVSLHGGSGTLRLVRRPPDGGALESTWLGPASGESAPKEKMAPTLRRIAGDAWQLQRPPRPAVLLEGSGDCDGDVVAWSPSFDRVYLSCGPPKRRFVRAWSVGRTSDRGGETLPEENDVSSITVSPDGERVGVAHGWDQARVYDSTLERHRTGTMISEHPFPTNTVSFHEKSIATAGGDGRLRVWDEDGRIARSSEVPIHSGSIRSIAFSPDGKLLASVGRDRALVVTRVSDFAPLLRLTLPEGPKLVAFHADQRGSVVVAVADEDGVVTFHPLGTSTLLRSARGRIVPVTVPLVPIEEERKLEDCRAAWREVHGARRTESR